MKLAKARIRELGEQLDAHRKRVQAQQPGLTLTGLYNVLEALRSGSELTEKDKLIHDRGLVSVLRQLHDDLDAAVCAAYGWPAALGDADILTRLVALNAQRHAEESQGIIHWLRPDYQTQSRSPRQGTLALTAKPTAAPKPVKPTGPSPSPSASAPPSRPCTKRKPLPPPPPPP